MIRPRLRGAALKRSNVRLHTEYVGLVKHIVGIQRRQFSLSASQSDDLEHSYLLCLFRSPASYRNKGGVYTILRTKRKELLRKVLKHEPEISVGIMRAGEGLDVLDVPSHNDIETEQNSRVDLALIQNYLDCLTGPERVVLGMTYGLDQYTAFPDTEIAKRLGKDVSWITRKRQRAILKLQEEMGLAQTLVGVDQRVRS